MSEPPVNKTARWLQNYSLRVVHLPVKEKAMSEPKPLKVLTSADDVLDVMMEHYVDGDFGYFREGDASEAIWTRIEATIDALKTRIDGLGAENEAMREMLAEEGITIGHVALTRKDSTMGGTPVAELGEEELGEDGAEGLDGCDVEPIGGDAP